METIAINITTTIGNRLFLLVKNRQWHEETRDAAKSKITAGGDTQEC